MATDGKQAELSGELNQDPEIVAAGSGQQEVSDTVASVAMPAADLAGVVRGAKPSPGVSKARPRGAGVGLVGPFLARLRADGNQPEDAGPGM